MLTSQKTSVTIHSMVPIRPDHFDFTFDPNTLESLRKRLGLTQAVLAEQLDVPVNTVSRWETGATTPDAKALAAIYSIAKRRGVTPQFFKRRASLTQTQNQRTKLFFVWDFQNHAIPADEVQEEFSYVRKYLDLCFPKTRSSRRFLAYTGLGQFGAGQELEGLDFDVIESFIDADSQIIKDVQEACQTRPAKTVIILVTNDGNFSDMLLHLKRTKVDAYVWGSDECNERLRKALGDGRFVHWDAPFVVTECVEVIKELNGEAISKGEFGNRCKNRLDESAIYPDDVGFSRRNPYGILLQWLEAQGFIVITSVSGRPKLVTIKLLP